ncbi:MAG TPA: hypothetical protein VK861_00180 [Bacteroidales bacterium]|nr:hypothetical protein [Bacteroidales bacterium]
MKKRTLILFFILLCTAVYTQDNGPGRDFRAGVYTNVGWNLPVRMTTKYITEETSPWHGRQSWSGGAHLSFMVSEFYRIEIAPRYSWHKIGFELSPPIYQEKTIYTETFELISVPVTIKRYLTGSFFISAGTMIDFAFNGKPSWIDPQSGFGLTLGTGKECRVKAFVIDLSPVAELHSVVPFAEGEFQQRLFVVALRIGISYSPGPRVKPLKTDDNLNVIPDPEL